MGGEGQGRGEGEGGSEGKGRGGEGREWDPPRKNPVYGPAVCV